MDTYEDQQFLETVVTSLVDHPEDVKINRTVDEMGVLLTLDVHAEDMGKIIGRSGNTAKAIRTLLRVVGMKHDARVNLKINEPEGGRIDRTDDVDDAITMSGEPEPEVASDEHLDKAIEDLKI
ncbi:MAG TPA: KH domain-containing protein [Candidatus Paceibacterota bacterium]|nr:KH domain-containing protein [Candidatus Paceibacterota bacterium]